MQKGFGKALAERDEVQRCANVDVLSGGFPCQDISYAGAGAGLEGERSGLWREMLRAVRLVRPKYAVVENVAALLDRGMGTVLGGLAESGYDSQWDCVPAGAIGAPHVRDRIWLIAHPEQPRLAADLLESRGTFGEGIERAGKFWNGGWVHEPPGQHGRWLDAAPEARVAAAAWEHAPCEPLLLGVPDGVSQRVDRIAGLGNSIVPQIAEWIGRRLIESE